MSEWRDKIDAKVDRLEDSHSAIKAELRGQSKMIGQTLIEVRKIVTNQQNQSLAGEQRFTKIESEISWLKKVGIAGFSALGLGRFFT